MKDMSFKTELEMSKLFRDFIFSNINDKDITILQEFSGLFGRPDYLIIEKEAGAVQYVISIELKLKNWRKGLDQAFKYRSFSNLSLVVIDEAQVNLLENVLEEFKHYNIGLGVFNKNGQFKILYLPDYEQPYSVHLVNKMLNKLSKEENILKKQSLYDNFARKKEIKANNIFYSKLSDYSFKT